MQFLIADTFTDSLSRLTADEQKAVKTTAFDLQTNPSHPSLQFHRLDRAKDKSFWSVRAGSDVRLIVHKTDATIVLCYAHHHDRAYAWAERRKLTTHPTTGAAQLVEVRERVQEIVVPVYVEVEAADSAPKPQPLFANRGDAELLSYGVPEEWLEDVRQATEESILSLSDHLPAEAAEALLELATGGTPQVLTVVAADADPFEHPDAQRRFRVVENVEELERAFEFPWEKWTIFLHPAQRDMVERDYGGPARVSGSAGTGKTIVALHRTVFLARAHEDARILLTTFSDALANALRSRLHMLISSEPRLGERIEVHAIESVADRLYEIHFGKPNVADRVIVRNYLHESSSAVEGHRFGLPFLMSEWEQVVDAWQLDSWEAYRDVQRLGRKTRLAETQRATLWQIFERTRARLKEHGFVTRYAMFTALADRLAESGKSPYDLAVIDEAQDMAVAHLRFFAALGSKRPNGLFFAGDLGQRIFQAPFSWRALGVDVRGRARVLNVNYRTSHQIRRQADRLLDLEVSDVDGIVERRDQTISVFNGPEPVIRALDSPGSEGAAVAEWLSDLIDQGVGAGECAVFVRSEAEFERAQAAVEAAGALFVILDGKMRTSSDRVSIGTMHLAKGLEFRAVAVMACDDEVIPSQERISLVGDEADLEDVYKTERHLLYVACTRARDHLLVTGVSPGSEFLEDIK